MIDGQHARVSKRAAYVVAVLLAAAAASGSEAQETTGELRGRVVATTNHPVMVVVFGPMLPGTRTARAERNGQFQVLRLPPGIYSLAIEQPGAGTVLVHGIEVQLGRTTALEPVELSRVPARLEQVQIVADRELVDPVHADFGAAFTSAEIAGLPLGRDYTSIADILPHISESHRGDPLNAAGSTGLENAYFVDGVNVTNPLTGAPGTRLPHNFVRAVEVKTGGYEARYGRAMGAVINAVTYSGSGTPEAQVFGFVSGHGLMADPKQEPVLHESGTRTYDVGLRASGPLARGRLRYAAGLNPRFSRSDRTIRGWGAFEDVRRENVFAAKLAWRATSDADVELSLFGDPSTHSSVAPPLTDIAGYAATSPDPYLLHRSAGGFAGALHGTVAIVPGLLVEAVAGWTDSHNGWRGSTQAGQAEPFFMDHVTRQVSGGVFDSRGVDAQRLALTLRGTLSRRGHVLIFGTEYEKVGVESDYRSTEIQRVDSSLFIVTAQGGAGTFRNRVPTGYLQDTWKLSDRLAINAGMRWSSQTLTSASGAVAQRFADEWQPRAGFVWQPGHGGNDRVFGSAGRFYQQEPLSLSTLLFLDYLFQVAFYSADPRVPGSSPDSGFGGLQPESFWVRNTTDVKAEHYDEFTLAYERFLAERTTIRARLVRRELRSSFQWGYDIERNSWSVGTPGRADFSFLPRPRRSYTGLELASDGTARGVRYRASYVWSRNRGNYPGLYDSDMGVATPGGTRGFIASHQAANSIGALPNDRPHVFKLALQASRFARVTPGVIFTWASGTPINAFAPCPCPIPIFRSFTVPRGSAGRTPSIWDLDTRIAVDRKVTARTSARLILDVLNIGNPQQAVRVEELRYLSSTDGQPSDENPGYRTPIAYQQPAMVRLGMEFTRR